MLTDEELKRIETLEKEFEFLYSCLKELTSAVRELSEYIMVNK